MSKAGLAALAAALAAVLCACAGEAARSLPEVPGGNPAPDPAAFPAFSPAPSLPPIYAPSPSPPPPDGSPAPAAEPTETDPPPLASAEPESYGRLPAIYLATDNGRGVTSKTQYISGTFSLRIGEDTLYDPALSVGEASMQIKGRGHSSWLFAKKPYHVKLDEKLSLFGLPKAKNWVLRAGYSDKSLIRDHVASVMGNTLSNMSFVPHTVLVDLYLNGSYRGVYTLTERIDSERGRLTLFEDSWYDTGYLIEIGGTEEGDVEGVHYFNTNSFTNAYVHIPDPALRTDAQMRFITDYVQKADAAVLALDGYDEYIDIPSLIDWFILHELTYNLDSSFRRSCFMTKNNGEKLKMGPPWDFDLAFGNHFRYNNYPNVWASVSRRDGYVGVTWMDYLLTDPAFTSRLRERWLETGDALLETALREIDLCEKVIARSQEANFKAWNILGRKTGYEPDNIAALTEYSQHTEQMRSFLLARKAWIDSAVARLP
ncbi:MAG: CotH kinase family protein [Oscillospiraceae bacterium]|jgi:hypothetical protein|nr:CotH kinase family protein [Oscillospiraceae bacterium]